MSRALGLVCVLALAQGLFGCKKEAAADATKPLQQSFATADAPVQQAIVSVTTSLKSGNYVEATRALAPIVGQQKLTDPQKQAIGTALAQINQAIAKDPSLDTKEMYELRQKLFRAVDGGSRF